MPAPRVVLAAVVLAALLVLPRAPTRAHYQISAAGVSLSLHAARSEVSLRGVRWREVEASTWWCVKVAVVAS